jgi:hypothetical protein
VALLQGQNAVPSGPPGRVTIINAAVNVFRGDLFAFRPTTEHLPPMVVPEPVEDNIGIRRNGDDDNGNGVADLDPNEINVANENDLLIAGMQFSPTIGAVIQAGWTIKLQRSSEVIQVWTTSTKASPYFGDGISTVSLALTGDGSIVYFYVEWKTMAADATSCDLELWVTAPGEAKLIDRLTFHPFKSEVIVFNGEGQVPGAVNDGTTQIVNSLRYSGYDAYIFDEDDVGYDSPFTWVKNAIADIVHGYDPGQQQQGDWKSFAEVINAVRKRGVKELSIIGYSHGGGAEYVLSQALQTEFGAGYTDFDLKFTAYIDAVAKRSPLAETHRPLESEFHVNLWQSGPGDLDPGFQLIQGGNVAGPAATTINDNVDSNADGGLYFPLERHHTNRKNGGIAESRRVQSTIIDSLEAKLNR